MSNGTSPEVWRPIDIPGYPGVYEASSLGLIRSIDRVITDSRGNERFTRGRIMNQQVRPGGYVTTHIQLRTYLVHELILEAFVGPCPAGLMAIHRDQDFTNNQLSNLDWGAKPGSKRVPWTTHDFYAPLLPGEEWRPVVSSRLYEVSSLGRVREIDTRQLMAPSHSYDGYEQVGAGPVHRLVLEAFVGPRPHRMHACHWDDDKCNNSVTNLRWDTATANMADKRRNRTATTFKRRRDICNRKFGIVCECRHCVPPWTTGCPWTN